MGGKKTTKPSVGGSAAEGGMDFQARVNAIVMAHLLSERQVRWLEGVLDDTPLVLEAETGGPGDDIRIVTKGGKLVEVQAKRGLQRGGDLWDALLSLSHGICAGSIDAGVLAVCPNSSGSIRGALAGDIIRLGTGRSDGLHEIGKDWAERLSAASLDASQVCRHLRIVVVGAVDGNREAEATAAERLSRVIVDPQRAWTALVECGRRLIRYRGRATPEDLYRDLSLAGVALKTSDIDTRVQLIAATCEWLHCTHANMTVLGVNAEIPFESCWLDLEARLMEGATVEQEDLDKALRRYHEYGNDRRYGGSVFDSQTTARFVRKCVVVGGPGIGKSTLLRRLALSYSADGFLTLLVRLPRVVALMTREGRRFEDCLWEVALSGSGLRAPTVSLEGAVILCDALDECGSQQQLVTRDLHAFSVAHPCARIVVTTRPIGYRPGEIAGWRHYELQPLGDTEAEEAVLRVLNAIPFGDEAKRVRAQAFAKDLLGTKTIKGAASRSPLMMTMLAALSSRGVDPGHGKASLYRQLFKLLEDHPPPRLIGTPPSEPERGRFLEMLGWCVLSYGNEAAEQTLSRCARWWSGETAQPLLISEAKVGACLEYWECLGVVERVRTLTQEAITFVHKTFGEYAAGRYMSRCDVATQRDIVACSIRTPEWKEALSFASHLGLASLILQVWAELTEQGDTNASYRLEDAVELVIEAGVPVAADDLASFAQCCWAAVENTASRVRYAAGEGLCLMSRDYWSVVREATLARLESGDPWIRLVAWACRIISPDEELAVPVLIDILSGLDRTQPSDSSLDGFHMRPTENAVWRHLVLGAARRILVRHPEPMGLRVLNRLIGDGKGLIVSTLLELGGLFKNAGLKLTWPLDKEVSRKMASLRMPTQEDWNSQEAYLLELIDDQSVAIDDDKCSDAGTSLELAALLTATSLWKTPISDFLGMSAPLSVSMPRRMMVHAIARASRLDHSKLVQQARALREQIHCGEKLDKSVLSTLPRVDAEVNFDKPMVSAEHMPDLEELILSGNEFFALNAMHLLRSLREQPEYPSSVERLLVRGKGESLRFSVLLACELPTRIGQQLLLDRLCCGESTSGCRYLYQRLSPPFGARHIEAVRKGLEGPSPEAAKAAVELVAQLDISASDLRRCFEEWKAKEEPYPRGSGVVPNSPREGLAKVLLGMFSHDESFLLELLADERPDVREVAQDPALTAAKMSPTLRNRLVGDVKSGRLRPEILRTAVSRGLYSGEDAKLVVSLLRSNVAGVRYAALPILDLKYLPPALVQTEATLLLTDVAMDIREGASRALRSLELLEAEGRAARPV